LRHIGEEETADQIDDIVNSRRAAVARPARQVAESPIPVDSESRLPVADEQLIDEPVDVVLPSECQALIHRFLMSVQHAQKLHEQGVSVPNSILLHGPPGCGKTLLAHSIAQSLSRPVVTARADGLVSSYLGSTAKNIRSLFEYAMKRE